MSKKSNNPKVSALKSKAIEMRRRGATLQEIATEVSRSISTVSGWLKASGAHGLPQSPRGRRKKSPIEIPTTVEAGEATAAIVEALGGEVPPPMMPLVKERLPQITAAANVALEQGDRAAYRDFVKMEVDLARQLMAMIPPKPPDPEDDPANEKARERVRQLRDRLLAARDREAEAVLDGCCDDCRDAVAGFLGVGE